MTKVRAERESAVMVFDTLRWHCCGTTATTQRHARDQRFAVVPSQPTSGVKHWLGGIRYAAEHHHSLAARSDIPCESLYLGPSSANLTASGFAGYEASFTLIAVIHMNKTQFDNDTSCGIINELKLVDRIPP